MRAARAGAEWESMSTRRVWMSAMRWGSLAWSASASSAARSVSASRTKLIRLCSPPGASCSTRPRRTPLGMEIEPDSGDSSPAIRRNNVVLPAPLRPTKPTRARAGNATVASSISSRSPRR